MPQVGGAAAVIVDRFSRVSYKKSFQRCEMVNKKRFIATAKRSFRLIGDSVCGADAAFPQLLLLESPCIITIQMVDAVSTQKI